VGCSPVFDSGKRRCSAHFCWYVLEALDGPRRVLRAAERYVRGGGKGGVIANLHTLPSTMAQNFWIAIMAFVTRVVITTVVSLATAPRPDREMEGLVYGLTKIRHDEGVAWYQRPATLAIIVLVLVVILNIWFA